MFSNLENLPIITSVIIPLLSFLFQSYPRFFNKHFGIDLWMRMMETDLIRENNHRVPTTIIKKNFIFEGRFSVPPIFPWLLSYIPKKTLMKYQGFVSPFFDCLQNLLVFILTYQLTNNIVTSLVAQAIYATMPVAILENSYMTPRSFGYLILTLSFYPILYYSNFGDFRYLITGFILTVVLFLSHRFALQSYLFLTLFFSIFEQTLLYLFIFLLAFLTAVLMSRGYYLRVLKGHLAIIRFWIKNYEYRFAHQIRGLTAQKKRDFLSLTYFLLSHFSPITLVGINLWLALPLLYLLNNSLHLLPMPPLDPFVMKLLLWTFFCYLLSVIVLSVKYLVPIGEGQRYLEMALVPTAISSSIILSSLTKTQYQSFSYLLFFGILLTNILITVYVQLKAVIQDKTRSVKIDTKQIFKFLNTTKPLPRIMCIPHYSAPMYTYNTRAKVLMDIEVCKINETNFLSPILTRKISDISKEYLLDYLVLNKHYSTRKELGLLKNKVIFKTDDIEIIDIKQK